MKNKIKRAIDEELEFMVVDEQLKTRTLSFINPNRQTKRRFLQLGFITKGFTLVSTFVVLVVLSMNFIFRQPDSNRKGFQASPNPSDQYEPNSGKPGSSNNKDHMSEESTTTEEEKEDNN